MTIHKGNIEAYLLDYLEGNLDPLVTAELMAFMAENPGYETWLPEYDGRLCLTEGTPYENKSLLKRDFADIPAINTENLDEFCIASAEGILSPHDEDRLKDYLSLHAEKLRDYDLFHQLKLRPDMLEVYPDKEDIKRSLKRPLPYRYIIYALAAAASVALLVMLTGRRPPVQKYSGPIPADTPVISPRHSVTQVPDPVKVTPSLPVAATRVSRPAAQAVKKTDTPDLLAELEPVRPSSILSQQVAPGITRQSVPANKAALPGIKNAAPAFDDDPSALKLLANVIKKLNFWKAAESAVMGFNYLTESQLSISKTTDQNGKLTGLGLETGQYTISGNKIK